MSSSTVARLPWAKDPRNVETYTAETPTNFYLIQRRPGEYVPGHPMTYTWRVEIYNWGTMRIHHRWTTVPGTCLERQEGLSSRQAAQLMADAHAAKQSTIDRGTGQPGGRRA